MYDFVTHTFNTIKGECPHFCSYCYMKKWGKQNPVRFDEKELKTDLGKGNFIFVGSSCDMFADAIPDLWIERTLEHCEKFDNKYLFQTKNPKKINKFLGSFVGGYLYKKSIVCITLESDIWHQVMQNSPKPIDRALYFECINIPKYITIEPIIKFNLKEFVDLIKDCGQIEQINIGADSGNNNLPEPSEEEIFSLVAELEKFTTVKLKSNLKRLIK